MNKKRRIKVPRYASDEYKKGFLAGVNEAQRIHLELTKKQYLELKKEVARQKQERENALCRDKVIYYIR